MAGRRRFRALPAAVALLVAATAARGGEIEPRAYVNTPVGVNFLLGGYAWSKGGLAVTGSSPLEDPELTVHSALLAYARSLDVGGMSGKFDAIVPVADLSGNAMVGGERRERDISGMLDPLFRFSVNFHGAPALTVEEFPRYRQDLLLGASLQVSAPLGQYDGDKLVNLGNHRWFFKPDAGISKQWGDFTLELSAGLFLFTRNRDYFGGRTLGQDPILTTQAHATYNLGRGFWVAGSVNYDHGGRTEVDGVKNDDSQNNSRAGATFAFPVNRYNSVKLHASTDIRTSVGKEFDLFAVVWQHRWGAGL